MTNAKQDVECSARDRSATDSACSLGRVEQLNDAKGESCSVIREFGDLAFESNQIAFIKAMILDKVIPPHYGRNSPFESTFMKLPRGTMYNLIATQRKLYETFRNQAALLLEV